MNTKQQVKHTAGPWEVSFYATSDTEGDWDVCGPDGGDMLADLKGTPNAEANARLIAAALDLLLTLNRIRDKVHATFQEGNQKFAIQTLDSIDEIAQAAIAKAEGRS